MARHASDARGHHMRMLGGRFVPICNWLRGTVSPVARQRVERTAVHLRDPFRPLSGVGTPSNGGNPGAKTSYFFIALANKIYDDMGPAMKI